MNAKPYESVAAGNAAINIVHRIPHGMDAEVIRLSHNRSVDEVMTDLEQADRITA